MAVPGGLNSSDQLKRKEPYMPDLALHLEQGDHEYQLALSWDGEDLAAGSFALGITAARWPSGAPEQGEEVSATVSIEEDEEGEPILQVRIGQWAAPPFHLSDLQADSFVEQVFELVPAWAIPVDLLTACLLRSGVSATVGQVVKCRNETEDAPWPLKRTLAIVGCLRDNLVRIGMIAGFRAARCLPRAGFP